MPTINIQEIEKSLVIHFNTDDKSISAYTLASTLAAIADAAKYANGSLNPGFDIEVVVEALGPGSFRAQLSAVYKSSKNLFSSQLLFGLVVGVLGNFIYERTLSVKNQIKVEIFTEEVIISQGDDRVIVPRPIYDSTRRVAQDPQFEKAMSRVFESMADDPKVKSIGLVPAMNSPMPEILIPKESLQLASAQSIDNSNIKVVREPAEIQIVKAILDKSKRKWEFMWRGFKISAPVTHDKFYADFFAHDITIAPGDTLKVTLAIKQDKDPDTGIYTNIGYEVVEVHDHIPRIKPQKLIDQRSNG